MSLGKCKLNQFNATTHLSEWLKSKTLTTPNGGEDVEQQELSFTAGGNEEWYNHCGRQFGSFLQDKHSLTYDPAVTLPGIYPKELET